MFLLFPGVGGAPGGSLVVNLSKKSMYGIRHLHCVAVGLGYSQCNEVTMCHL